MIGIAWRNFILQFPRYRVLTAALILGSLVFTVLFGVTASLTGTVRGKAARYFSGDVMVLAFSPQKDWMIGDESAIREAIDASHLDVTAHHRRSLYYETDAKLIFNGTASIQRRVIGLDFDQERENFSRQEFVEGGVADPLPIDGLWVSNDTANRLHVRTGDEVTLMLKTVKGARNTVALKLAGVFQDSSFFGFASYLDFRTLNRALGRPTEAITELGVSLSSSSDPIAASQLVWKNLSQSTPVVPWEGSLAQAYEWTDDHPGEATNYAVLPLSGRLRQINDLIQAIQAVSALLALVFLVVVAIGVYNTYQMIAFERTKEVGTMRALGMQKSSVIVLFLTESMVLGLLSSMAGLLLGAVSLWFIGLLDFSGNPMAQMFLEKGHVAWVWPWQNMIAVLGVMWMTTLAGAALPAWRSASRRPVDALRHE